MRHPRIGTDASDRRRVPKADRRLLTFPETAVAGANWRTNVQFWAILRILLGHSPRATLWSRDFPQVTRHRVQRSFPRRRDGVPGSPQCCGLQAASRGLTYADGAGAQETSLRTQARPSACSIVSAWTFWPPGAREKDRLPESDTAAPGIGTNGPGQGGMAAPMALTCRFEWAVLGLNQWPLPCQRGLLFVSSAGQASLNWHRRR